MDNIVMEKLNIYIKKSFNGNLICSDDKNIKVPKIFTEACNWNGIIYGYSKTDSLCIYIKSIKIPLTEKQSHKLYAFRQEVEKAIQNKISRTACDKDYETFLGIKDNVDYSI